MTRNHEIARSIRRALFMSACAAGGVSTALAQDQDQGASPAEGDTIVVTGSRIVAPNLQAISPVTALSAEDIVRTGRSSIEDVINELPQVFRSIANEIANLRIAS